MRCDTVQFDCLYQRFRRTHTLHP